MADLDVTTEQGLQGRCGPAGLLGERCICWVASTRQTDGAVSLARDLVWPNPCHLVLCLDSPDRVSPEKGGGAGRRRPLTPEVIGKATVMLRELYGPDTSVMVLPGRPLAEIRRYARTNQVSLIVMGKQALTVEAEYGERLLDDPPCPILVFVEPQNGDGT